MPSDSEDRTDPADAARTGGRLLVLARNHPRAPVVWQFAKFATVGVSNTALTFVVYTVLVDVFGVYYLVASAIGFAVGAVNGFLLNRRWTFQNYVGDALTPVRWTIVQGCGLALDEALLYACVHGLGLGKLFGQAAATAVVVVATFFANRAWTFRTPTAVQTPVDAQRAAK